MTQKTASPMATENQNRRKGSHFSAHKLAVYRRLGIGALAIGTIVLAVILREPGAPVPTAVSPQPSQANRGHHELPTPEAPPITTERAAKDDGQPTSKPINPATIKMSPEQWQGLDELLVRQLKRCWVAASNKSSKQFIPKIKVVFKLNGTLQTKPMLINTPADLTSKAVAH